MNLGEILASYRRQTKDLANPPFVSDEDAIANFNEGQREAARRARLIVDSTSSVALVPVSASEAVVEISSKIISIRRIRLQSSSAPLRKYLVRDMDERAPGWDTATQTSQPSVVVVDYETDKLFLYPAPKSDDTLLMTVTREPLEDVTEDGDVPEVNARYHRGIIEWMKYRAYINDDSDLFDAKQAASALARFEEEFGPAIGAINERFELEHYDDVGER